LRRRRPMRAEEVDTDDQGRALLLNDAAPSNDERRPGDIELADVARVPDVQVAGDPNGDLEAGAGGVDAAKRKGSPIRADGATKAKKKSETSADDEERGLQFAGLTKDELEQFAKDPFWHRLRLILFVLFWAVWLAMFAAVIIIIVLSPSSGRARPLVRTSRTPAAPAVPSRSGSLAGLAGKVTTSATWASTTSYWGSLVKRESSGCPLDFAAMDTSLGSLDQIRALTKRRPEERLPAHDGAGRQPGRPGWKLPGAEGGSEKAFLPRLHEVRPDAQPGRPAGLVRRPAAHAAIGLQLAEHLPAPGARTTSLRWLARPSDWYRTDPAAWLNSPDGANFVRSARAFIDAEADARGRELALFVDLGDVAYPIRFANLSAATFGAHAVVHTGLGRPLLPAQPAPDGGLRAAVDAALAAAGTGSSGSFAWASNWPYLRRDSSPALAELGMSHVAAYRLSANLTSYLTGADSTDPASSPMQWTGSVANAGWLPDPADNLSWAGDLSVRASDIRSANLRKLNASGYSDSNLKLIKQLVGMATMGRGRRTAEPAGGPPELVGFTRKAYRFPAVLVLINNGDQVHTVDPSDSAGGSSGQLKLLYSWGSASHSYSVGSQYKFSHLYVPSRTALVFVILLAPHLVAMTTAANLAAPGGHGIVSLSSGRYSPRYKAISGAAAFDIASVGQHNPHLQQQFVGDWGPQGLLAVANGPAVLILEPETVQVVQTLLPTLPEPASASAASAAAAAAALTSPVSRARWGAPPPGRWSARLAVGHVNGRLLAWDALDGRVSAEMQAPAGLSGRHSLADADWPSPELLLGLLLPASSAAAAAAAASGASSANSAGSSGSATASAGLAAGGELALWNSDTGALLWRRSVAMSGAVPDSVFGGGSLCLDPFDRSHCLVFLRSDPTCVLFFSDLTPD
uniref:SLC3A2_N domain-containing protein n=1 Tax=Macrostomum lignano TaxID=282301 RepID=A0A1I8FPC5_9PLAT